MTPRIELFRSKSIIMNKHITFILIFLLFGQFVNAGKIEKKISIGRKSDCKGLAFNCSYPGASSVEMEIQYQESSRTSFAIQINLQVYKQWIGDTSIFLLEEDWQLSSDIIQALKLPSNFKILKGTYHVKRNSNVALITLID